MTDLERAYAYIERFYLAHKDFVSLSDLVVFSDVLYNIVRQHVARQAAVELGSGWLPANELEAEVWKNGQRK